MNHVNPFLEDVPEHWGPRQVPPRRSMRNGIRWSASAQILLTLMRGPAIDFEGIDRLALTQAIRDTNRQIAGSGRRVVGRWVRVRTRLGLRAKVKRYRLVRWGEIERPEARLSLMA